MFQSRATRSWTRSFLKEQIAREQSGKDRDESKALPLSVHSRQRGDGVKEVICTDRTSRRHIWTCSKFIGVAKMGKGRKEGEKGTKGRNQGWSQRKREGTKPICMKGWMQDTSRGRGRVPLWGCHGKKKKQNRIGTESWKCWWMLYFS